MTLLSQTERLDFFATVASAGFSKEDFTVRDYVQNSFPIVVTGHANCDH